MDGWRQCHLPQCQLPFHPEKQTRTDAALRMALRQGWTQCPRPPLPFLPSLSESWPHPVLPLRLLHRPPHCGWPSPVSFLVWDPGSREGQGLQGACGKGFWAALGAWVTARVLRAVPPAKREPSLQTQCQGAPGLGTCVPPAVGPSTAAPHQAQASHWSAHGLLLGRQPAPDKEGVTGSPTRRRGRPALGPEESRTLAGVPGRVLDFALKPLSRRMGWVGVP